MAYAMPERALATARLFSTASTGAMVVVEKRPELVQVIIPSVESRACLDRLLDASIDRKKQKS